MGRLWMQLDTDPGGAVAALFEILVIAAFIFLVIRTIHGTRGAGVARGALVLFFFIFLSVLLTAHYVRLDNLRWIMDHFFGVSLLAVVMIFQPEIRRALIRIGESALRFYSERGTALEKELTDAAFQISKRCEVGALLVIERKTKIGAYIETGVILDALVSAKLLSTIFTKNTPLHDGAVIIRQGRLIAANCLLPLSENVEVCRGMGTRHRAAIGLSEETDAVVIVVSEETAAVSVALHGTLHANLDYDGLRTMLIRECAESNKPEPDTLTAEGGTHA